MLNACYSAGRKAVWQAFSWCCSLPPVYSRLLKHTEVRKQPVAWSSVRIFVKTGVSGERDKLTDFGSRTVSSTCSIAVQAMKSVKVTVAAFPPVGVIVKGFRATCVIAACLCEAS